MTFDRAASEFLRAVLEEDQSAPPSKREDFPDEGRGRPLARDNVFIHHDTHPVVLDMALFKTFGMDWLEWEPETLRTEIERASKLGVSELNWNQIQAVKTMHVHDAPWKDYEAFVPVILALNNNIPVFTILDKPSISQLMAGVDMMKHIRDDVEFDDEVIRFMSACFLDENVFYAPPPLEFLQDTISQPRYRCPDCGNDYEDDNDDGLCDFCAERFTDEHPFNFKPSPGAIEKMKQTGEGTRVERYLEHPFQEVKEKYDAVKDEDADEVPLQETMEDVQVAKLLVARDYMLMRRHQLREQTAALRSWLGDSA